MKKYLSLFLFAGALIIISCGRKVEPTAIPSKDEPIPVKLISLEKSESGNTIYTSGTFTTDDETQLSFKTGGVISHIYVKEGDKISKGQVLATLDVTEVAAQVNQAKLAVDKSLRDYNRVKNLFNDSVATLEQLQNAQTGKEIAEQQYAAARFNLAFSQIRATSHGVVLRKMANPGQVIGSGMPVLQTSSKGSADWLLKVSVSDREWGAVSLNDSAHIHTDTFEEEELRGIVSAKSENADLMTGSFTIEIKIIDGQKLNIASGMFGKATLYPSTSKAAWVIPYEALLDGNGNKGFVFATNDKRKATKVQVTISEIKNNSVIISKGLEKYQYLVTSGSAYLTDQSLIKESIK